MALHVTFSFTHIYFPASGQAVVTGVVPSPPAFLPQFLSRIGFSNHRVLLNHALALSTSQFVHKKKSPRIYTSMHSAGLELANLTYTRLEDDLIRHRGDRLQFTFFFSSITIFYFHHVCPDIGQFREFEPRRVHTRINSLGLFLVDKLTCGKRESVS